MRSQIVELGAGRTLFIESTCTLAPETKNRLSKGFVVMLHACNGQELQAATDIVSEMIYLGCNEFCCVGQASETLHDSIDGIIEDKEAFDIVTTWHTIIKEGSEYFLNVAGNRPNSLLALVADDEEHVVTLLKVASNYVKKKENK